MAPSREKRKPVFDPNAIDDVLDAGWSAPAVRPLPAPPPPPADSHLRAVPREETPTTAPPPVAPERIEESARRAPARRPAEPTTRTTKSPHPGARAPRPRPPEVLLSADVYQRLAQVSAKEKLDKPSKARPFGVIVMDALEHHAQQLATAWTQDEPATPVGGALFIRPVATVVPRRRRHITPARNVPLAGIDPANARLLDEYVVTWNAGTRSALVEQALRYEFGL